MDDEIQEEILVFLSNEFEEKIAKVFLQFDNYGNKTVSIVDLPLIVRGLGCIPTEQELQQLTQKCTERESPRVVHLAHFLPFMLEAISAGRYKPETPELLLRGFQAIDSKNRGYLTPEYLKELLTTKGEPLSEEEVTDFLTMATDPSTGQIPYEFVVSKLKYIPKLREDDVYTLAADALIEKPKHRTSRRFSMRRQSGTGSRRSTIRKSVA